jgi:hypothetical protein
MTKQKKKMSRRYPPVVIIGMHRSGTSLLASILQQCGVFMGARKNAHGEAYFFLHRNQRIFRISHAHWDQPEPVRFLVDYPGARSQMIESLRAEVSGNPCGLEGQIVKTRKQ